MTGFEFWEGLHISVLRVPHRSAVCVCVCVFNWNVLFFFFTMLC